MIAHYFHCNVKCCLITTENERTIKVKLINNIHIYIYILYGGFLKTCHPSILGMPTGVYSDCFVLNHVRRCPKKYGGQEAIMSKVTLIAFR